jgi:hypothetical protein
VTSLSGSFSSDAPESDFLKAFEAGFRYGNDAFSAGDVETALGGIPEGIEFHPPPEVSDSPIHGRDQWIAFVHRLLDRYGKWRVEPLEFIEPREGVIVIKTDVSGDADLPVTGEVWQVWEFDQGIVFRVREFRDEAAAFEAVEEGR